MLYCIMDRPTICCQVKIPNLPRLQRNVLLLFYFPTVYLAATSPQSVTTYIEHDSLRQYMVSDIDFAVTQELFLGRIEEKR